MKPLYKKLSLPVFLLFVVSPVAADDNFGLSETGEKVDAFSDMSIPETIGSILGTALSFVGIFFLVLVIYGGFMWMFAAGNEQQVDKAKKIISSAVIGLIIIMAAYAITSFVGGLF
jgi:cbb3-type cytochrome oxidase subunit 3